MNQDDLDAQHIERYELGIVCMSHCDVKTVSLQAPITA